MAHLSSIQYVMVTKIIISMMVEVRDARGGAEDKKGLAPFTYTVKL